MDSLELKKLSYAVEEDIESRGFLVMRTSTMCAIIPEIHEYRVMGSSEVRHLQGRSKAIISVQADCYDTKKLLELSNYTYKDEMYTAFCESVQVTVRSTNISLEEYLQNPSIGFDSYCMTIVVTRN